MKTRLARAVALFAVMNVTMAMADGTDTAALQEATVALAQGYGAKCVKLLQPLLAASGTDAALEYTYGRCLLSEGDFDDAITQFQSAIRLEPSNASLHLWRGKALGTKLEQSNMLVVLARAGEVKSEFETAIKLDPSDVEARQAMLQYYLMAPALVGGGQDKAAGEVEAIGKIDRGQGLLADAYLKSKQKQDAAAIEDLKQAVKMEPTLTDAKYKLGFTYQNNEQYDSAIDTFTSIVSGKPDELMAFYQVGKTAVLAGAHLDEGEKALKYYLKQQPRDGDPTLAWAHLRLAQIYAKESARQAEKGELDTAASLAPSDDYLQSIVSALEKRDGQ